MDYNELKLKMKEVRSEMTQCERMKKYFAGKKWTIFRLACF